MLLHLVVVDCFLLVAVHVSVFSCCWWLLLLELVAVVAVVAVSDSSVDGSAVAVATVVVQVIVVVVASEALHNTEGGDDRDCGGWCHDLPTSIQAQLRHITTETTAPTAASKM